MGYYDNRGSSQQAPRQGQGGFDRRERDDAGFAETNAIKIKLDALERLSQLEVKEATKRDGYAETIAKTAGTQLKSSQLRRIYNETVRIKNMLDSGKPFSEVEVDVLLMTPKLVYAMSRQSGGQSLVPKPVGEVLITCLGKITEEKDFYRFHEFLQAIVAYNKLHGKP